MPSLKIDDVVAETAHLERHSFDRTRRGLDEVVDVTRPLIDRHAAVGMRDQKGADLGGNSHGAHRGHVPDGRAVEAQRVFGSEVDDPLVHVVLMFGSPGNSTMSFEERIELMSYAWPGRLSHFC